MLSVGFQCKSNYFNNKNIVATNITKSQNNLTFKGNVAADAFVLVKEAAPVTLSGEFQHIADVLKQLGVRELALGDNIDLARLLKSALQRVSDAGYDIPTRIKCEAEHFEANETIREHIRKSNRSYDSKDIPAETSLEEGHVNVPIIYFNTKYDWGKKNQNLIKAPSHKHIIWHEVGHWLHIQNYGNNPIFLKELSDVQLNPYQRYITTETLGYRNDNPVHEIIAEIFAKLMSGEIYSQLHPGLRRIYSYFRGPIPRFRASNAD